MPGAGTMARERTRLRTAGASVALCSPRFRLVSSEFVIARFIAGLRVAPGTIARAGVLRAGRFVFARACGTTLWPGAAHLGQRAGTIRRLPVQILRSLRPAGGGKKVFRSRRARAGQFPAQGSRAVS